MPVTVFVQATFTSNRSNMVATAAAFLRWVKDFQCDRVMGTVGFVLIQLVPSMVDYEQRAARRFVTNEPVQS